MQAQSTLTPAAFAAKWRGVTTTEKAGSQSHFIDLCRLLAPIAAVYSRDGERLAYVEKRQVGKAEVEHRIVLDRSCVPRTGRSRRDAAVTLDA